MSLSRVIFTVPLLYQQLFYCPPPPPAAEVVDTISAGVSVSTSQCFRKTLFYQAKVQLHAPPEVLSPPAPTAQSFTVTTGQLFTKTRFYQAKIEPVPLPTAVVAATIEWVQPLSRAPTRRLPVHSVRRPFVPAQAAPITADEWLQPFRRAFPSAPPRVDTQPILGYPGAPQVTADEWLQPFTRAVSRPPVQATQPVSGYQPEVSNLTTTLEWMPAWPLPPRYWQVKTATTPFVPKEAVLENTVDLVWLQPFYKAVQPFKLNVTDVTYAEYAPVVSNLTATLEWQIAWQGPPRVLRQLAGGTVDNLQPSNLTTSLEWQIAWKGPPRYWPIKVQAVPFVPKEATRENTIDGGGWDLTTDGRQGPPRQFLGLPGGQPFVPKEAVLENTVPFGWQSAWQGAKPTKPVHTQPFYGYPYAAASNLTTTLEWQIAWQAARPTKPIHTQPVLPVTPSNLTTTLEWQIAWQGPPRIWPLGKPYQPFVPREATLENTLGHIAWHQPFYKAIPYPPINRTQPFFGYPYEFASNLTTSIEWLQKWQGPPRIWPLGKPYQPFVPKEATLENTLGNIPWLQAFKGPPRYWPIRVQQTPFIPKEFVQDRVTPDKWQIAWQGAKPSRPTHTQPLLGYPPIAVVTLTTTLEWQPPLSIAVKTPPVRRTQPVVDYQPIVAVQAYASVSVTTSYPFRRSLFYQAYTRPLFFPPFVDNTITIDKWQQPLSSLVPKLTAKHTQPFYGYPYEGVVPPVPPVPIPPKHAHGQIHVPGGETRLGVFTGTCVPAFQTEDSFQATAFQTCEVEFNFPVSGRGQVRTARSTTSSRWRKSRTNVRTSRSRTRTKDDP